MKKAPRNYSQDMDRRRQGMDYVEDHLLPDVSTDDAGKIMKVSDEGSWILGDDENTIIEANPEDTPTIDLNSLKIGSTTYSVKDVKMDYIKAFRITISNGGQYLTNKPIIDFYDEAGNKASITSSDYEVTCDKTYQGNANMDQVCSLADADTPGTFTYVFNNDFDTATYKLIKLTRGGTFPADIAKNISIELSADGTNFIEIYDETTITWSDAVTYHLIDLTTGEESSTLLPIVSSSDNTTVLQVSNGVWDKGVKLPVPTSGDNGKSVMVNSSGKYELNTPTSVSAIALLNRTENTFSYDSVSDKYTGKLSFKTNDSQNINFPENNINSVYGNSIMIALYTPSVISVRGIFATTNSTITKSNLQYSLPYCALYDIMNDRMCRITDISFDSSNNISFKLTPIPAT